MRHNRHSVLNVQYRIARGLEHTDKLDKEQDLYESNESLRFVLAGGVSVEMGEGHLSGDSGGYHRL